MRCNAVVDVDEMPCGERATTERGGHPRCAEHAYEDDCAAWTWDPADHAAFLRSLELTR